MATSSVVSPSLSSRRSTQSGNKAMTAAFVVQYAESSTYAYLFMGAEIDLSGMLAADVVDIRVRKQLSSGGGWVIHDQKSFSDAQPATHVSKFIGSLPDVFGIEIAMRQTAGALLTIPCEFFDAKRLGSV